MFRWLVLIALVLSVILAFAGWFGKKNWAKRDHISGLVLTIFMDIQFLVGLILYFFASPIIKAAFADFGAAMKNADLRFYAVEHILMMFIALVLVHIGRMRIKRIHADWKKHRAAVVWYGISLLLILAAIPWNRALM
jgi:hypothetical protein